MNTIFSIFEIKFLYIVWLTDSLKPFSIQIFGTDIFFVNYCNRIALMLQHL